MRSYSDEYGIYSVDMMLAYVNLNKPRIEKIKISDLMHVLDFKGWGDINGKTYSASDVLKNPSKYKNEIKRIKDADLNYPIIIQKTNTENKFIVIDGVHRLSKALLKNSLYINAYIFDKENMKKFLLKKFSSNRKKDWTFVDKLQTFSLIQLYNDRFCK